MPTFRVRLWPDGKWDFQPYQNVEAETAKEAVEKLYGKPLRERGRSTQLRATVHPAVPTRKFPIGFYDIDEQAKGELIPAPGITNTVGSSD